MNTNLFLKQLFLFFALGVLSVNTVSATHIIGSEISHEYIGNHNYVVQIKLYRDCSGIPMTNNYATVTMKRLDYSQGTFTANLPFIGFNDVTGVCPSEPTICTGNPNATFGIEEYIYKDTVNVPFDVVSGGVVFYWSSCCYPSSITTLATTNITIIQTTLTPSGAISPPSRIGLNTCAAALSQIVTANASIVAAGAQAVALAGAPSPTFPVAGQLVVTQLIALRTFINTFLVTPQK